MDNIKSAYNRLVHSLRIKNPKPLKSLRKTCSTKLDEHEVYGRYWPYFLGHSPRGVGNKHYTIPSKDQFDAAVNWLGEQFGLVEPNPGTKE